ncbi:hypothetical protein RND81_14G031100 [Saponaria officinalis]|uniref:Laccase n=1 Tax=Saponaria officinalis TaxID=3572 RepID=A0AAW1GPR5_SAPOF
MHVMQLPVLLILAHILFQVTCQYQNKSYTFVVKEATYTRLCNTKSILTVNGQYPGPTIYAHKGDTVFVKVINKSNLNITLHWHGVKQPRNPWSDGPEYITQCPIQPGGTFKQLIILSDEEGTLWWHAHSKWARATVHGAMIIYPKLGTYYPFPKPDYEVPVILGEWWISDVYDVYNEFIRSGGTPNVSDAYTINGQPGDLYDCSSTETFKFNVRDGDSVLMRIINAAMNTPLFVAVSGHPLTVVGTDASYTKPLTTDVIAIGPGQTFDALLDANKPSGCYYIAARAYSSGLGVPFSNTTTTAIIQYDHDRCNTSLSAPSLPTLPNFDDINTTYSFISTLRSLASVAHPIKVPKVITHKVLTTASINTIPCSAKRTCGGPNGTMLKASMNNISFVMPNLDLLEAYYYHIKGVYLEHFPKFPPLKYDYTADNLDLVLQTPDQTTRVMVLPLNSTVEITIQGTNLVGALDHPMHLHGQSFYVVGMGFGNFDKHTDPKNFNLKDPPLQNTVMVLKKGWTTIRFIAKNPGVWYMHCHIDRHQTWGMMTALMVLDGEDPNCRVLPPPPDMPPC